MEADGNRVNERGCCNVYGAWIVDWRRAIAKYVFFFFCLPIKFLLTEHAGERLNFFFICIILSKKQKKKNCFTACSSLKYQFQFSSTNLVVKHFLCRFLFRLIKVVYYSTNLQYWIRAVDCLAKFSVSDAIDTPFGLRQRFPTCCSEKLVREDIFDIIFILLLTGLCTYIENQFHSAWHLKFLYKINNKKFHT